MAIAGKFPEAGVRLSLMRGSFGPPWAYRGELVFPEGTPSAEVALSVDEAGVVSVQVAPEAWHERIRLMVKAAWKPGPDAPAPPRTIARWRK
jgi:hypothetical protein